MSAHVPEANAAAAAEAIPAGRFLAPHYASMGAQLDATKLGMWLFLASEVLFFGGLGLAGAGRRGGGDDRGAHRTSSST